jgi:hypothetical protein
MKKFLPNYIMFEIPPVSSVMRNHLPLLEEARKLTLENSVK